MIGWIKSLFKKPANFIPSISFEEMKSIKDPENDKRLQIIEDDSKFRDYESYMLKYYFNKYTKMYYHFHVNVVKHDTHLKDPDKEFRDNLLPKYLKYRDRVRYLNTPQLTAEEYYLMNLNSLFLQAIPDIILPIIGNGIYRIYDESTARYYHVDIRKKLKEEFKLKHPLL